MAEADEFVDLDDLLGPEQDEDGQESEGSPQAAKSPDEEFDSLPDVPVPVEHTDAIYRDFEKRFGPDEARSLQDAFGDQIVGAERIARAFIEDTPEAEWIISAHETETGGLSIHGLDAALKLIMKQEGVESPEEIDARYPALEGIWHDAFDERTGVLSASGLLRMIHAIAKQRGYRFKFHGGRR